MRYHDSHLRCVICDYCEAAPSDYADVSGYSEYEYAVKAHYNDPYIKRSVFIDKASGDPLCSQCRRETRATLEDMEFMDGLSWKEQRDLKLMLLDKKQNIVDNTMRNRDDSKPDKKRRARERVG